MQLEMATLRSEISHIRRQLNTDKSTMEVKLQRLQSEIADVKQNETIDFIIASATQTNPSKSETETSDLSEEVSDDSQASDNSQMSYQYSNDEEGPGIPEPNETLEKANLMLQPAPDPTGLTQQE